MKLFFVIHSYRFFVSPPLPYGDIAGTVRDVDPMETEMGDRRERGKGERMEMETRKTQVGEQIQDVKE